MFTSCEREIQLKYPQASENLVLNSYLTSGDSATAVLGLSVPYEDLSTPPYIDYGNVQLFENDISVGNAVICKRQLRLSENGDSVFTYCFDHIVNPGSTYRLVAEAPGFDPINGFTEIASTPNVDNVGFSAADRISFTINDPAGEDNYYFFQLTYDEGAIGNFGLETPMTTQDLTIEMIGFSGDIVNLPTGENIGLYGFISDGLFQGGSRKIDIGTSFVPILSDLELIVTSCSKSFYEYSRTSILSQNNGDSPFSDPYQVFSNVSNGYGLVGSSADTLIRIPN